MKVVMAILLALSVTTSSFIGVSKVNASPIQNSSWIEPISPMYLYTNHVESELSISGTTAYCNSKATGLSSVTKIEATQYLEKKVLLWWSEVDSWNKTVNSNSLNMSNTEYNIGSGTYRLRTVFKVYSGSNSEEIEKISS